MLTCSGVPSSFSSTIAVVSPVVSSGSFSTGNSFFSTSSTVTAKTLKYTHSLKCGVEKYSPGRPKQSEIKINENVQETPPTPAPTPVPIQKENAVNKPPVQRQQPPKIVVKDVVKSYDDMRKERLSERLKQRAERNVNLSKQVL